MSKSTRFEDVPVWQEAARLYNMVLDLFEKPGSSLSLGFRNQLNRAALSVSNNIAEGFEGMSTEDTKPREAAQEFRNGTERRDSKQGQ